LTDAQEAKVPDDTHEEGGMLLIVDDDPRFLEAAERALDEQDGVLFALDALQARSLMGMVGEDVSAVLIDLSLPRGCGTSLIREMSRDYPDLPIIATSTAVKRNAMERAKALGAADQLRKPVTSEWNTAITRAKAVA
jgi:DNA-binding NtrC family response regulator